MKVGISFFPVRPAIITPMACRADELGYESIWLGEHLLFPSKIESKYPYNPEAGAPLPSTPLFDPFVTFSFLAARTRQIRLGTGIFILPLRHPVHVARHLATLDVLSEGRTILGIGAGWLKEEFDAVGMPWEKRGSRMEECVDIMRQLWLEPLASYEGQFYRFEETGFEPKPAQGRVPILVGGEAPVALKRAARIGDGWYGMMHTPESASTRVRELAALRESEQPLEITVASNSLPSPELLAEFREAGVDRLVIPAICFSRGRKSLEASLEGLEWLASEVMQKVS